MPPKGNAKTEPYLKHLIFTSSQFDPCFYMEGNNEKKVSIVVLYVEDLLPSGKKKAPTSWMNAELCKKFEIQDESGTKNC